MTSSYELSERNWDEDPLGDSHKITPATSPHLIVLQPKRKEIDLKFNPENSNEILIKVINPHHRVPVASNVHGDSFNEDNSSVDSFTPPNSENNVRNESIVGSNTYESNDDNSDNNVDDFYQPLQLSLQLQQRIQEKRFFVPRKFLMKTSSEVATLFFGCQKLPIVIIRLSYTHRFYEIAFSKTALDTYPELSFLIF